MSRDSRIRSSVGPVAECTRSPEWIVDAAVDRILTHDRALKAVSDALACHANGDVVQPLKPYLRPKGRDREQESGRFIAMLAFVGGDIQAVGVKWIASMPNNINRGMPRASGLVVLNDPLTGVPIAVMECATLSARRTAAVAALSVDLLGPIGGRHVAIIGAGPINAEVVTALGSRTRGIETVYIFDPRRDRAEALKAIAERSGLVATVCDSIESTVASANIIITATVGAKRYIQAKWLGATWLIIALSLDDFEPEVLLSAEKVICDDFEQSAREEKLLHELVRDGRFGRQQLYAELGEIVVGRKRGREYGERIYVNPMGMAIEDIAVAAAVYQQYMSEKSLINFV
jgi:2,3-diaminopropionate biosynthesis protein SbnB